MINLFLLVSEDYMQWINVGFILGGIFFFIIILEAVTKRLSRGRRF